MCLYHTLVYFTAITLSTSPGLWEAFGTASSLSALKKAITSLLNCAAFSI
jgi:hypothetical protein